MTDRHTDADATPTATPTPALAQRARQATEALQTDLFIDGSWVPAASGARSEVVNQQIDRGPGPTTRARSSRATGAAEANSTALIRRIQVRQRGSGGRSASSRSRSGSAVLRHA